MPAGLNRALQVRTADRLRAALPPEVTSGLPDLGALSEADRRELCEVGAGRLAVVALCLEVSLAADSERDRGLVAHEVARLIDDQVRRTDLLGWLKPETLLVLAPGLDAAGANLLAQRLLGLLSNQYVDIAGMPLPLRIRVGSASRSHASASGWTTETLGVEAQLKAIQSRPATAIA